MKRNLWNAIGLFLGLSSIQHYTYAQWQTLPVGYKVTLTDMSARDANRFVCVGRNGAIVASTDGGATFDSLPSGTNRHIQAVTCTPNHCFALLGDSILVSTDYQNWDKYLLPSKGGSQIHFYQNRIGFITGGAMGEILRSDNAGMNWTVIKTNLPMVALRKVFFVDEQTGYGLSQEFDNVTRKANGYIWKTTDGGATWVQQKFVSQHYLADLCFTSPNSGFAVGDGGVIYATIDGGQTWNPQTSGVPYGLNKVTFVDNNVGYASGYGGAIVKTTDRGNTWTVLTADKMYRYDAQAIINFNTAYLMVAANMLLKTTTGGL